MTPASSLGSARVRAVSGKGTETSVERHLACPLCHSALRVRDSAIVCLRDVCGFRGLVRDGVAVVHELGRSFFDDRFEVMEGSNRSHGVSSYFYERQGRMASEFVRPGKVVLDVGCGPSLPYVPAEGSFVIGLEASFPSIRANRAVHLPVFGTAASLPLPPLSVDVVICFYSIHHMVGRSVAENRRIVRRVMREFGRVIRRGGDLLVFEVSPWLPFWVAQQFTWSIARRVLGSKLDMYFWPEKLLSEAAADAFPRARLETHRYREPLLSTFSPIFSVPWLKVPRILYPFHVNFYRWRF